MILHFFLPHKHKRKYKKAHLLSQKAIIIYLLSFVALQLFFSSLRRLVQGVLGTTSAITKQDIISLTNAERQKNGFLGLKENTELDHAAEAKAKNMFEENYWAHLSPSGKSPWVWIQQAGYKYRYAGENLARSFNTSQNAMDAWMASTMGHRENILNNKYQEIGVAVEDGVLNGEKTTLIVQLFGTQANAIAIKPQIGNMAASSTNTNLSTEVPSKDVPVANPRVNSATVEVVQPPTFLSKFITINTYAVMRLFTIGLIVLLSALGLIDLYVSWCKGSLSQLHTRHATHIGVISLSFIILFIMRAGSVI